MRRHSGKAQQAGSSRAKNLPALPNLDYKIRRANSLIDQVRGHPVNLDRMAVEDKRRLESEVEERTAEIVAGLVVIGLQFERAPEAGAEGWLTQPRLFPHGFAFDWRFVSEEIRRGTGRELSGPRLCTVRLAKTLLPELSRRTLDVISGRVRGLPFRCVHPEALPAIGGPVIVHIDDPKYLRRWTRDVPSVVHAWRLRRGPSR